MVLSIFLLFVLVSRWVVLRTDLPSNTLIVVEGTYVFRRRIDMASVCAGSSYPVYSTDDQLFLIGKTNDCFLQG